MSHAHAEVWVPEPRALFGSSFQENIDKAVEVAMEPYQERDYDDDIAGFWDWWQIGGRWTGAHVPGYDPEADPNNIEICQYCNGTGFRTDRGGDEAREKDPTYTCNACGNFDRDEKGKAIGWKHGAAGAGKTVKWPTSWAHFPGDIMAVKDLPESLDCYTLLVKDFIATGFNGLVVPKLKELGVIDGYLVTVDYHS